MKFTPGPIIGAASGSAGGNTFSHNKGGPYMRTRAIPTNPNSTSQLQRRAALATTSQAWSALTGIQRDAWASYAQQNPVVNALGSSILLSGHQHYVGLNSRILLDAGTQIAVPPVVSADPALRTFTQTTDIGAGTFEMAFTDALVSGNKIELRGAIVNSAGIKYVKNLMKHIAFSPVDQATGWSNLTAIEAVLGTMTVGQTLHLEAAQFTPANGLRSPFLRYTSEIVSTV